MKVVLYDSLLRIKYKHDWILGFTCISITRNSFPLSWLAGAVLGSTIIFTTCGISVG